MTERLTQWFDGSIKPSRVGVYERDYSSKMGAFAISYCKWDGTRWCLSDDSPDGAARSESRSRYKNLKWRGLVKP